MELESKKEIQREVGKGFSEFVCYLIKRLEINGGRKFIRYVYDSYEDTQFRIECLVQDGSPVKYIICIDNYNKYIRVYYGGFQNQVKLYNLNLEVA